MEQQYCSENNGSMSCDAPINDILKPHLQFNVIILGG